MPDAASILRVAQQERDQARQALDDHKRVCRLHGNSADCWALEEHASRTQLQVELLGGEQAGAEHEGLFDMPP